MFVKLVSIPYGGTFMWPVKVCVTPKAMVFRAILVCNLGILFRIYFFIIIIKTINIVHYTVLEP